MHCEAYVLPPQLIIIFTSGHTHWTHTHKAHTQHTHTHTTRHNATLHTQGTTHTTQHTQHTTHTCRDDKGGKALSRDERRHLAEVGRRSARSDVVRSLAAEVAGAPEEERYALPGLDRCVGVGVSADASVGAGASVGVGVGVGANVSVGAGVSLGVDDGVGW